MGSSLSVTPFAVDDPEIEEVLDLRTGQYHRHDSLIGNDYEAAVQLRLGIRTAIIRDAPDYTCALCGTPVYLVCKPTRRRLFFRHTLEDGRCTAKTRGALSQKEINARKYNGAKESHRHLELKSWIAQSIATDPSFTGLDIERRWTGALTGNWRKPDVCAVYRDIAIAFEIQLSTTFLDVIAERREFYLREGGLLVWVFGSFDEEARRLTQDDIFYNNNRNAFLITEATLKRSLAERRFVLDCVWSDPGREVSELQREAVYFDQLTLDRARQRAFYFDFDASRMAAKERHERELSAVRVAFESWWLDQNASGQPDYSKYADIRKTFAAQQIPLPFWPKEIPEGLLNGLYSAKHGRVVGWAFKRLIEVAHRIEQGYRGNLEQFRTAIEVYGRVDQLAAEDGSGKWRAKMLAYDAAVAAAACPREADSTYGNLIAALFPEVAEQEKRRRGDA